MFGENDSEPFIENELLLSKLGRRKFLGLAAATTAAWVAGMEQSEAASSIYHRIPKSMLKTHGRQVYDYARYLERFRLRRIDVIDIIKVHNNVRGRVRNIIPPKKMWRNIGATLRVADKLSIVLRKDVKGITSVYRSPSYNRQVGGKSRSYHMRNNALDIQYDCSPYHAARVLRKMRDRGYFKGGVGDYSGFIHIDTRGHNVDW